METLPETKIQKTGRLGANAAASDAIPHAGDDRPEQPASDLRNAETSGGPVPLPDATIQKSSRLGGNAAAADAIPRSLDDKPEQPASDLRDAETTGSPAPLPEANIQKTGRLRADAAAADIVLRSSTEDPDQVASDRRLAEDYARATGRPAPPLELMRQFRDTFRQKMQEAQNAKILSEAPVLADWLRTPGNADLAGDDVPTLAYFERIGRPTTTTMAADGSGGGTPPATPPNGSTPAPPEKTVQEMLAEEVAGARGKSKEEIIALQDQLSKQPDSYKWLSGLQDVLAGKYTGEEVLAVLNPTTPREALEVVEFVKGLPGGALEGVGKATEGVGQWAQPFAEGVDNSDRDALIRDIAAAKETGNNVVLVEALHRRIDQQNDILRTAAHEAVRDIADGTATPEEVILQLTPPEALNEFMNEFIRAVPPTLQKTGEEWQDMGPRIFPARPGMEDSIGRKGGRLVGSAVPGAVIGLTTGGTGAVLYGAAVGAGEAASAARKAGQDEAMQTKAAYLGAIPGALGGIPALRLVPGGLAKYLPQAGAAKILTNLGAFGVITGVKVGGKQVAQNWIAQSLYAPDRKLLDGIPFLSDSAAPSMRLKAAAPGEAVSIAEISGQAQASKLRQRDPERFRQYLALATANSPVEYIYVPARELLGRLREHGLNPDAVVGGLHGVSADDVNLALAANSDLRIPTATYAASIAGSELDRLFIENARFSPDGATSKEAVEFMARTQELMKEAEKNAEAASIDDKARRVVEGVDKNAETGRINQKTGRIARKASGDAKAVDMDDQARRAVEGVDKDAETARINRKTGRIARKAP